MADASNSRRDFLKATSAAVAGASIGSLASANTVDPATILNYHPKMGYRQLGKTGMMISEVSLAKTGRTGVAAGPLVLEPHLGQIDIGLARNAMFVAHDLVGATNL